jgi:hypothetical protein
VTVSVESTSSYDIRFTLALDILVDMILKFQAKKANPDIREATLSIMEKEFEDQLDFEMTCELLGTNDFRFVA